MTEIVNRGKQVFNASVGLTPPKVKLHIGCGKDYMEDYVNLDKSKDIKADVYFDLESCAEGARLPFDDDTFEEIFAAHTLEHIENILPLMQELYRVAKHECVLLIRVPYGATASAFDDPTHVRYFYPSSFMYFGQPAYHRADYGYTADWRVEEVGIYIHSKIMERLRNSGIGVEFAIHHLNNVVHELVAALIAIKPARERNPELIHTVHPIVQVVEE